MPIRWRCDVSPLPLVEEGAPHSRHPASRECQHPHPNPSPEGRGAIIIGRFIAMLILTVISIIALAGVPRTLPAPEIRQPELDQHLPPYTPCKTGWQRELSGSAPPIMPDLVYAWIAGFSKWQPGVSFQLGNGFWPPQGRLNPYLQEFLTGQRDFAFLSRELATADLETFIRHHGYPPLAIPVAMGSWRHFGFVDTVAIIVNDENPLHSLTLAQVDAIFSASRLRGHPPVWHWGELGVAQWDGIAINIVGASAWNNAESARALSVRHTVFEPDGQRGQWRMDLDAGQYTEADIPQQVAAAPYAIGFTGLGHLIPGARALALSITPDAAPIAADYMQVASGDYPLSRRLYLLVNIAPGEKLDPVLADFARYLTNLEGQQIVLEQGVFLPLREQQIAGFRQRLEHLRPSGC